jgi:internalin A
VEEIVVYRSMPWYNGFVGADSSLSIPRLWRNFMKNHARLAIICCFLPFAGSLMIAAEPSAAEKRAVAIIEKLGGKVRGDVKRSNHPIIEVDLGLTNVTDADLQLLKDLPDLQVLDLHRTKVTDKGLEHLKGLVKLRGLHLHDTRITDEGIMHLKGLTDLRWLNIYTTGVSPDALKHLNGMTKLERLQFVGINDAGLAHLKGLTSLKELHLYQCYVTDAGLAHLVGLTNLQGLRFGSDKITDDGLKQLEKLTALRSLSLDAPLFGSRNPITDKGLDHLRGLTNLENLDISDTTVTNAGVKRLQQALPKLKIEGRRSQVGPD